MRILVIGATGLIGRAVVAALVSHHEIVAVTRHSTPIRVDIAQPDSIRAMYQRVGSVDAVVGAAGLAKFGPLATLDDDDFKFCLDNKLMGQVNLVRSGFDHVRDRGSFVLTSGVLSQTPMIGSAAISLINAGLEGFTRAAALEAPRGIRVNVVSPPWLEETLRTLGMDPAGGLPAVTVARAYVQALEGAMTGIVIEPAAAR